MAAVVDVATWSAVDAAVRGCAYDFGAAAALLNDLAAGEVGGSGGGSAATRYVAPIRTAMQ